MTPVVGFDGQESLVVVFDGLVTPVVGFDGQESLVMVFD